MTNQDVITPSLTVKIAVAALFAALYLVFLVETAMLIFEFRGSGLAFRLATLDAQNFLFFPTAGLLALVGFYQPSVILIDGLARNHVPNGRYILGGAALIAAFVAWSLSSAFAGGNSRSMFEVEPATLMADQGETIDDEGLRRAAVPEVVTMLSILADSEETLSGYRARCDSEWLQFSPAANDDKYCIPAGETMSIADCCRVKSAFRDHINALHGAAPSDTSAVHRVVMPVKIVFLVMLFFLGILLVTCRTALYRVYGKALEEISFGIAVGGVAMLIWPLSNAAYLETISLLTGDGSANLYEIIAPLVALGFGVWALLLVFFHLRTYPGQIEYAARIGGFVAAAIGVLRYEEITAFLINHLGIGGSVVPVIIFAILILTLVIFVVRGVRLEDIDFDRNT